MQGDDLARDELPRRVRHGDDVGPAVAPPCPPAAWARDATASPAAASRATIPIVIQRRERFMTSPPDRVVPRAGFAGLGPEAPAAPPSSPAAPSGLHPLLAAAMLSRPAAPFKAKTDREARDAKTRSARIRRGGQNVMRY